MKLFFPRVLGGCLALLGLFLPSRSTATVLISEIMYHPSSEDIREEYLELYNPGPTNVNLAGWRFSSGVQFTFPNVTLPAGGYLVVAADVVVFTNKHPGVTNVFGNWTGRLSNSRNSLDLDDAAGNRVNSVEYADEGDWAIRLRTPPDRNHRGWVWFAEHDGLGKSLELINPGLSDAHGQNWASSLVTNGTPGTVNSVRRTNVAPLILDVQHLPPVPRSVDNVLITARLLDERGSNLTATLRWRLDGAPLAFTVQPMLDDGLHDDGLAGDGLFAATLPPQANNAVVEFYLEARDAEGQTRTWPAPAIDANGGSLGQAANALYQVDDSTYSGTFPLYKLIMKDADRAELAVIGSASNGDQNSNAQMNGTFICVDGTGTDVRPLVGIRNRGHGSRNRKPNNCRVNFSADHTWKGVTALNINSQYSHAQLLGAVLSLKASLAGADSRPVQVRVNNVSLANNGPQTYGGMYVANEVPNSDWAEHWYPADSSGNVYRTLRDISPSDFAWRGSDHHAYTNTWFKQTNASEDDWTDLMSMLRIVGTNDQFTAQAVRGVCNIEQWMTYLAVMALFNNQETSLYNGYNDDYMLYAGVNDRRFRLMYYDLDSILGQGSPAGSTSGTIFGFTNLPAFNRLLNVPEFRSIFYRTLQRLVDTTFSKSEFDLTLEQMLGDFVPANVVANMRTWMDGRRAYVQSVIAPYVATNGIPPVATVSGEPRSPTPLTSATLVVGGDGVGQYRYSLNGGAFGATNPVSAAIALSNLPNGSTNAVRVIGAGTNGVWQAESNATVSKTWIVNVTWPAVRINEVLARNVVALNHSGNFPDAIELFNEGSAAVDLSGLRLTDTAASPNKYSFPNGTTLAAGKYLVAYANNNDGTPGLHTGFSLNQDGEGVFLFHKAANGGALLDSVQFGLQLADRSIGRLGGGGEFVLTQPTLGTNNLAQPVGDPRHLKINEWLASEFVASATDFVELHNPEPLPVALGGLHFTDNPIGEPARHTLAPLSFIDAQSYRVFKADGDPQQGFDHLNFKLAAEQGLVALLLPNLEAIDLVLYGPQRTDVSQGRLPDGGNTITFFSTPTPGSANAGAPVPCTVTTTSINLMALTNFWKYNQTNNLDGVNWTATNYNDSGWPSGRGLLAFETNNATVAALMNTVLADPRTPPSGLTRGHAYYFRAKVVLTNAPAAFTFTATAYVDDGAVIYINGNELFPRLRMDAGAVTNATLANAAPGSGDISSPDTLNIPASMFVPGTNVIAAEVHQNGTSSSDIVWGMALDATLVATNCAASGVVLNEVLANNETFTNAAGRTPDWVELFNATTNTINLGDLSFSDDVGTPRKWVFPPGSSIAPGGRLVVECDDGLPASATNTGFGLSAGGEVVYLFKSLAERGGMLDSIAFGLQAADFSIGRIPDGTGGWALTLPTRETANVPAGLGNASSLKLNEWMASSSGGDDWLELHNPNSQPVELSGFALSDNPSVRNKSPFLPFSYLGPGGHVKLVADGRTGQVADHVGFRLNAAGGFLGLYWPVGTQIDAVSYGSQTPDVSQGRFPDGAAGFAAFPDTASPGEPNYLLLTNVVINELLSHTDPPLEDAVELRNLGSNAVDLSGWYLSNNGREPRKFLVPPYTVLSAGDYKVYYEYEFSTNTSPDARVPFNFNSAHGDEVHLSQSDGGGNLTGYRARAKFGASANGVSFGRFLTSVGGEFVAMSSRSFGADNPSNLTQFRGGLGAPNPYPRVGPVVFSEIHFAPTNHYDTNDASSGEFLELLSITNQAVPLYDPAATTNTWRIAGGVEFTFPANVTLPAGGSLLIVGFDPAADPEELSWFRSAYQVSTNVPIFGPYSGALANEGEDIEVLKPDPPQLPPHPDAGFVPYVLVEHVHYRPAAPWPTNGLGAGTALQRCVPSEFGNEPLNWFTALPTPNFNSTTDTDGDGLPDYWEIANGLNPTNSVGTSGPNGDPDGDRQSNRQEFLAGTNPLDGSDYLRIESVSVNANEVTLQFHAAGGHTYSVLYSDGSPAGPWHKLADVSLGANSRPVSLKDSGFGAASSRFYRLTAPAQPNP